MEMSIQSLMKRKQRHYPILLLFLCTVCHSTVHSFQQRHAFLNKISLIRKIHSRLDSTHSIRTTFHIHQKRSEQVLQNHQFLLSSDNAVPGRSTYLKMSWSGSEGDFFGDVSGAAERKEEEPENPSASSIFEENIPKLNIVTLSGRIGNDPEPRYFEDGKVVLNVSLAVKRKYHPLERKVREINYGEEETDWFMLEIWGRDAEFVAKYVDKGARIGVTGGLTIDRWTDKNTGAERSKAKIIVKHFDLLETKAEADLRRRNQGGGHHGSGNDRKGGY